MMKTSELSTAISQSHATIPLRFHALWYQNIKIYKVGLISSSTFRKLCSRYLETNQSKIGHSILLIKPVILFQKAEVGTPAFFSFYMYSTAKSNTRSNAFGGVHIHTFFEQKI